MGQYFDWLRQHAGSVFAGLVCLMAIVGIGIFILAFQECRFDPAPGSTWQYRLKTELFEIDKEGKIGACRADYQHDLDLLCWNADKDLALITSYRRGEQVTQEEISHLRISPKGQVSRYVGEELLNNSGQSVGHFFDFNLFPLPEGLEQTWTVPMVYGILPPHKNQVFATVRRVRNGSHPHFVLTFPPVAWVKRGPSDPYSQISKFRCAYTFDIARGIVEDAEISFIFARERPAPQNVQQVQVRMKLQLQDWSQFEDPVALRDTAMTGLQVQEAINREHTQKIQELLQKLPNQENMPHALRSYFSAVKKRLKPLPAQGNRPTQAPRSTSPERTPASGGSYALQIASVRKDRKSAALAEVKKLKDQGFKAFIGERNRHYIICIGPYNSKDQSVLNEFKQRYPNDKPFWVSIRR